MSAGSAGPITDLQVYLISVWLWWMYTIANINSQTDRTRRTGAGSFTLATLWLAAVSCEVFLRPSFSWLTNTS